MTKANAKNDVAVEKPQAVAGARRSAARTGGSRRRNKTRVWKPKNSQFYHMEFWFKGRRKTGTTKLTNRVAAEAFAKRAYDKLYAEHVTLGPYMDRDMAFLDAVNRYFDEHGDFVNDPKQMELHYDWLIERIGAKTPLSHIDDEVLARVIAEKRREYRWGNPVYGLVCNTTVNSSVLDRVRIILRKARMDWKVLLPNEPNYRRHRLAVTARVEEVSLEEEQLLCEARPNDLGPLIRFALTTGRRKAELLIRWDQVDWVNRIIRTKAKGAKWYETRITPLIADMLRAQMGHHPVYVWTYVNGGREGVAMPGGRIGGQRYPLTYNIFSTMFRRLCQDRSIVNRTIHDLRKTAGARMLRATGDIAAVSKFLNHANIALTMKHYVHITGIDIEVRMLQTQAAIEANLAEIAARRAMALPKAQERVPELEPA